MIQGAFTSDDAVDAEGTAAETHYTYFPGTAVGDGAAGATSGSTAAVDTTQGSEALLGQATPPSTGEMPCGDAGCGVGEAVARVCGGAAGLVTCLVTKPWSVVSVVLPLQQEEVGPGDGRSQGLGLSA